VAYLKTDANMQAAGGLVSSAQDMARWLQVQLNGGRLDGRQVIPAAAIAESQRIQAQTDRNQRGLRQIGYTLGWQVLLRGSDTLLVHGGGFTGFSTHVSFSPRAKLGVVVMANESSLGGALVDIVARTIYTRLAGPAEGADVPADMDAQITRGRQGIAADRARRASRSQVLQYPLAAYAGTYENASYGTITLRVIDGRLEAQAGAARSKVEVYDAAKNQLRVELSGSGSVMSVEMRDGRAETLTLSGQAFRRR
jgi:CubicO group peptidase (beta-lactamase class C family)